MKQLTYCCGNGLSMHADVNECETEDHQCADVRDCVDTEGGYYCLSSSTNIQSTTTIAPRTTTIGISSGWIESTAIAVSPGMATSIIALHCKAIGYNIYRSKCYFNAIFGS